MLTHQHLQIINVMKANFISIFNTINFKRTKTWTEAGSISKVQWAAVRMWRLVMIEPPQKGVISPGDTRPTYSIWRLEFTLEFVLKIEECV